MKQLFCSGQIASTLLGDSTGVVYTHLGKTEGLLGHTTIFDKIGIAHDLDLDRTEFIIQRKGEPLVDRLCNLLDAGQVDEALTQVKRVLVMLHARSEKGIKNKDGNVLENCGFIDDEAVELDVGSFTYRLRSQNPNPHKKEVLRATLQLLGFVKKHYPEHLSTCKEALLYENIL